MSRTNIVLDDELVAECMEFTGIKTKRSLVDHALKELLRKKKQLGLLELQGAVTSWEGDLDEMRQSRFTDEWS